MSVKQGGNTIAGGVTVDQTYDATSANAQSGTAVAGAISNMVTTDAAQNITGFKTFQNDGQSSDDAQIDVICENLDLNNLPSSNIRAGIEFRDVNGTRICKLEPCIRPDGTVQLNLSASQPVNGIMKYGTLSVCVDSAGKAFTDAPACTKTNGIVTQTGMSAGTNGYLKFGNSYIIQWGYALNVAPGYEVSFPTPFSSTNYSVVTCARYNSATGAYATGTYSESSTSFKVSKATSGNGYFKWVAFGK